MSNARFMEHWLNIDPDELEHCEAMYRWTPAAEALRAGRHRRRPRGGRFRLRSRPCGNRIRPARGAFRPCPCARCQFGIHRPHPSEGAGDGTCRAHHGPPAPRRAPAAGGWCARPHRRPQHARLCRRSRRHLRGVPTRPQAGRDRTRDRRRLEPDGRRTGADGRMAAADRSRQLGLALARNRAPALRPRPPRRVCRGVRPGRHQARHGRASRRHDRDRRGLCAEGRVLAPARVDAILRTVERARTDGTYLAIAPQFLVTATG